MRSAAGFVPRGARVLDFDGKAAAFAQHLPQGCVLVGRGPGPARDAYDIVLALDPFAGRPLDLGQLKALRSLDKPVILGLPAPEGMTRPDAPPRLYGEAGFARARIHEIADGLVLRLEPKAPAYSPERQVWILSHSNLGNFGDRLGHHLLSQVLPPHARTRRLYHDTWDVPLDEAPDLLIVGIGNSLFQPLLTQRLADLAARSKAVVGIFGTQYREAIDRRDLDALIDRMDVWWARYEADQHLYGRRRENVRHLGDWLIDAFPLARPSTDELLVVGDEIWEDRPLDRTIERIQAHSRVLSHRLHPLLCALTSAEHVAYREQREAPNLTTPSGKFRSMLIDVLGQEQPEGEFWRVDASAVADYKAKVRANIGQLREDLARLLA